MELAWNTQKNQLRDVKGKEMEQERKGEISNPDIDLERTEQNYDLVDSDKTLYKRVKDRVDALKEEGSRVQKNSVVMYSNILTVPKEQAEKWGEEKTDAYFKACYEFFCEEFGKENVVSAKVHKDETTPHMHLHFVPVNKENGKLQARVAMNKKKIYHIHDALPKFLQERGFDVVRASGKTKDANIDDIHEYKAVQKAIAEKQEELESIKQDLKEFEVPEKLVKELEGAKKQVPLSKRVSLPAPLYERAKDSLLSTADRTIKIKKSAQKKIDKLEKKIESSETSLQLADQRVHELGSEVKKLENKVANLEREVSKLEQEGHELRIDRIVSASRFQDMGLKPFVSEVEKHGRIMVAMLEGENGDRPKTSQEAQKWLEVLEENKREGFIPSNRLEAVIELLKAILEMLLGKERQTSVEGLKKPLRASESVDKPSKDNFSMDWVKERQKQSQQAEKVNKPKVKHKTWDMDL